MKALFPTGYLLIFAITIGTMILLPEYIWWIFGIMAIISIAWTVYSIYTSEELPKDLTDDETYDILNVKGGKK